MGMALANNEKTFLEFDTNAQGMEVLYFDMEVGENQLTIDLNSWLLYFPILLIVEQKDSIVYAKLKLSLICCRRLMMPLIIIDQMLYL